MSEAHRPTAPEPRALIAIDRSAQLCARAFPYLRWRYGEAGAANLRNDNAQIMSAALSSGEVLADQVDWVRKQGAARGLPSWLLELDLECMARSAARELPQRPELPARLRRSAQLLAARRHAVLDEGKFRRLAREFETGLGWDSAWMWRGFGALLASAVADERCGDMQILENLSVWATNARRFGEPWRGAVERCVYTARRI